MTSSFLVSVIIPAYNRSHLTVRTVESVLRQTYGHVEIIVVDDGSTDNTPQAMKPYESRVRYIRKPNGGASSARNAGIREARGEYIAFLDCDDLYLPEKIALCMQYLQNDPRHGFVHTAAYFVDDEDKVVGRYSHPRSLRAATPGRLITGNFICNSTVVARRDVLERAGFFDESMFIPADWDMWLKLSEIVPGGHLDIFLTMYRITVNYTFNRLDQARREEEIVVRNFFARNPKALPWSKAAAFSNLHLRFAQAYFLKGEGGKVRHEWVSALARNAFNLKAWVFLALSVCAPVFLRGFLSKKILRGAANAV